MIDLPMSTNGIDTQRHREIVGTLLQAHTPVSFRADGPSMNPTIQNGDLVHVCPAVPGALRRGHIVLFSQADRLTLHRYVERIRGHSGLGVTGDAALAGLERVDRGDIYGVAHALERNGQRVPLDTPSCRWRGVFRFYLRPLRRAGHALRHALRASGEDYRI